MLAASSTRPTGAAASSAMTGLTTQDAHERLDKFGPNRIAPVRRISLRQRLAGQLRDPLIMVLLVAVALTITTGDHADAIIIAIVVVANTAVGLLQEVRADQAIAALRQLSAPAARVMRDDIIAEIDTEQLVPGDVVVLAEGDIVPADAEVVDAAALLVDESALTGESVPVGKLAAPGGDGELSAGTVVVHGRAIARVTRTGAHSAMGRIAAAIAAAPSRTPLQRRLMGLGRVIAAVTAALCLVVMLIGLVRGQPVELMVVTAISLVVAAVPESLPAVVTLSLALGARRMAARHAIVRRLPAVETLGSVTVIATDKTGTLTEGKMVAEALWTPAGGIATISGNGYTPTGVVTRAGELVVGGSARDIDELLQAAVLCNDASLQPPTGEGAEWSAAGDPTEAALLAAAGKLGFEPVELRRRFTRVAEVPFDSDRKRMTTVHATPAGDVLVVCKGAPEVLLAAGVLAEPDVIVREAAEQAESLAGDGYRVLAIAARHTDLPTYDPVAAESGLRLLGLVAIADPPRPDAAGTVAACRAAGIIPVLITGDHLATAQRVAHAVGILQPADLAVSASDIGTPHLPDLMRVSVFARTDPTQKLHIIHAWQRAGHVVAMTGDGVNDGPALRRADIGVAMGKRGTEIARQAADMVLTDDSLGTVVAAVEEGRRVYANVRRFLLYGLSGGAAEILVMLIGPLFGLALPLLPAQILWVNLLTHGLPGVALGAEPSEPGSMQRTPRPPAESVIGDGLWKRVLALAVLVATVTLGLAVWGHETNRPWQSMAFVALASTQFGIALGVRARPDTMRNPFLLVAVAAAFVLQLAALYLPVLQQLLKTEPLTAAEVAVTCSLSAAGYVVTRLTRPSLAATSPVDQAPITRSA